MTKEERAVVEAALEWWLGHCPAGWTETQHLANPTINAGYTNVARALARAVAELELRRLYGESDAVHCWTCHHFHPGTETCEAAFRRLHRIGG